VGQHLHQALEQLAVAWSPEVVQDDLSPMGRFGEAKEMAKAALFLASDDSSDARRSSSTAASPRPT
jgi:NAD(P)-dependent dehydrogenase (short-subunit alcohol dehydrogenase family)